MNLIKKIFIKDYKNIEDGAVRFRYGLFAGLFGMLTNLLLFVTKIIIGFICGSITIIADAINNLSDMGSSIILIMGFKLSNKPADSKHPYGHARIEQVMALIVSVIVLMIGAILFKSSVEKLISNEPVLINKYVYIILSVSVVVKLLQMFLYSNFAKAIKSSVLKTSSIDSRNDIITTLCTILAMIIINIVGNINFSLDGLFGLLVSIFIIINSFILVKNTISPLLGESLDPKFEQMLKNRILSFRYVLGVHDFIFHSYGANNKFATAHVEVDCKTNMIKAHNEIDKIERAFKKDYNITLSIHIDPVQKGNEKVEKHKKHILNILKSIDNSITIHDFRMIFEKTYTRVFFDVVIPFEKDVDFEKIKSQLAENYKNEKTKYFFTLNLDRI